MRHRGLRSTNYQITNRKLQNSQRGYMLITLMLALALITIGLLTVLPEIGQQIRRDREEEMRHRGTAYMRAIQHFYKKFGRYPSRIEELENTNNIRFLRRRYKDPINRDSAGHERDFKLLHQTDITLNNGPILGQIPGQSLPGQGGLQGQSGFGGAPGGLGGLGGLGAQPGGLQQTGNPAAQTPASGDAGNPSSANSSSGDASDTGGDSNSPGSSSSSSSNSSSGFNGPTFGGGPILGVASASKAKTIRVFYDKNHYNDWLFIYVPQADRGGLLTGPVSLNGPTGNFGGVAPGVAGGLPGQVQGLSPNTSQPQGAPTQPPQNQGQTPPPEQ
jgi:type II secretory pathway pseudopilin PulG